MSSLPLLKMQAVDSAGAPLALAKLYFFETGTATPLATYSNVGLTSANANPAVADAQGFFGRIFMKTTQAYTVTLKTAAGAAVWSEDNVYATQLQGSSLATRFAQATSNPLDNGAVGDGSTNDYTALQAITAATGTVDLLGKTYRCDSGLVLKSGLTLKNGAIDFSQSASPPANAISLQGSIGSVVALTVDAALSDSSITVASVAGLAEGDWLYIYSSGAWGTGATLGELVQVSGVAGLVVSLKSPLQVAYATADSAIIKEITMVSNVTMENLSLTCNATSGSSSSVVYLQYAKNVTLSDVRISGVKLGGAYASSCVDVLLDHCEIDEDNTAGAGVIIGHGSRDVTVRNTSIRRVSIGVNIGLGAAHQTRGIHVVGCRIEKCSSYGVYGLVGSSGISVDDCSIRSCGFGVLFDGGAGSVRGCDIADVTVGIRFGTTVTYSSALRVYRESIACRIERFSTAGIQAQNDGIEMMVSGCHLSSSISGAIAFSGGTTVNNITGNYFYSDYPFSPSSGSGPVFDVTGNHISCPSTTAAATCVNFTGYTGVFSGNHVVATAASQLAALFTGVTRLLISGNKFDRADDAGTCIQLTTCTDCMVVGNEFYNGTYGVTFNTCTTCRQRANKGVSLATAVTTGAQEMGGTIVLPLTAALEIVLGAVISTGTDPKIDYLTASKEFAISWSAANVDKIGWSIAIPSDWQYSVAPTVYLYARMSGATNTPTIAVGAFQGINGADLGGATGALSGSAATVSRTLTALTSGSGRNLTISLVPAAHGTDAVQLLAAWVEYAQAL
jgi:hypothetical protein